MSNPSTKSCYHHGWWDSQIPKSSNEKTLHACNGAILFPLPSFSPSIDFDHTYFTLSPTIDEVADLEKAVYSSRSHTRRFSSVSTLCQSRELEDHPHSIRKIVPELGEPRVRRQVWIYRYLRHTIFTAYQKLFTFVFLLNLIGAFMLLRRHHSSSNHKSECLKLFSTLASSNFLLSILIRQDYLISLLFRSAWLVPWSTPIWFRRMVARIYCYGGIHSGAAVAGTLWWILFTVVMSFIFAQGEHTFSIVLVAWILLLLLLTILILAYPTLRSRYHNTFEVTHRFFGWLAIAIFWMQLVPLALNTAKKTSPHLGLGKILIHDPTFYNLFLITALLMYPWLRLRRWTFTTHVLSPHAICLSFSYPIHRFSCLSMSSSPLTEWHPFATFPSGATHSMVVSNAGDWTRHIIQSARCHIALAKTTGRKVENRQMRFWVKSHPKPGVLSLSLLFPRILVLTTGSGIGPALSSLLERPARQFARLVWSARSPHNTYGGELMALVWKAEPEALVFDTDDMGRPDLLDLAWRMSRELNIDAVFVLSNEKVTRRVVGGLEKRRVRAYGPIWDS